MTVREYIGARYVPLFMGNWNNTKTYEPLSIVQHQGNSYTSRQYVPTGIAITNETYWAETGNYNAQIEAYRQEVLTFDERISDNASDINTLEINLNYYNQKNCILIGDSYLRSYSTESYDNPGWGDYFITNSGFNEIARYKSGGAGWVVNGTSDTEAGLNFIGMLDKANENLSTRVKENLDYIIVQGIINDLAQNISAATIKNNIRQFLRNARSFFPKATIVISFAICSEQYMNDYKVWDCIKDFIGVAESGCVIAMRSNEWFRKLVSNYGRGDDIHPNTNGYNYLGKLIAQVANGNATAYHPYLYSSADIRSWFNTQYENASTYGTLNARISYVDGVIGGFVEISINDPSALEANSYLKLPIFVLDSTLNYSAYRFVGLQHASTGQFALAATGFRYKDGFLELNLKPIIRDNAGVQIEILNGDSLRYNFEIPMGGL